MTLSDIAEYVTERISSEKVNLEEYISTDSLLQNKCGRGISSNLPPEPCSLTAFEPGDVLVANIRPYLKKVWRADIRGGASLDVLVYRAKCGVSSEFLYSVLMQDSFYAYAMLGAKGTKMPRGDKDQMMRFPIKQLPKELCTSIGRLICNIDAKIAVNRHINHNLEALARRLYDYWFVQFDFPDAGGRPYKSSGGEMENGLPKQWRKGTLAEIADITMGQSPDGSSYNNHGEGSLFYQGCTDFGLRFPKVRQYTTSPTRFAKKGDILMSVRAPVGAVNIANNDCCIGRGLAALCPKNGSTTFLFLVIGYLKEAFDRKNVAGTTFGAITKEELHNMEVIIPSQEVVTRFEQLMGEVFYRQMILGDEINRLTKLRDELLPLLMNGQVNLV